MSSVIPLRFTGGNRWVQLRAMCGKDEQAVTGTRSIDAMGLLDRLIQKHPDNGFMASGTAALPVADRDQLLLAVFVDNYGPAIVTTVCCNACECKFEIDFSVTELTDSLMQEHAECVQGKDTTYPFRIPGGTPFRLPTGEDELAVLGMQPEEAAAELLSRCLPAGAKKNNTTTLQQAMQKTAPLLDAEFEARCPECSGVQWFHFNLQHYLLTSLMNEREKLVAEVHLLAKAYGWGLNEILELPRKIRKSHVALAET